MSTVPTRRRPWWRRCTPAVLALPFLCALACIELDGQRLAWFHDVERDELRILLFYDGIHDSKAGKSEGRVAPEAKSPGQIREFVEHGAFMLLDWPLHVDPERYRAMGESLDPDDPTKALAARSLDLVQRVRVENLGWYREPDGRVGAVQRLVIPEVSAFLADLNALIDRGVRLEGYSSDAPATEARWREAAGRGHRWVSLDGHALRFRAPVHPDEWASMKRRAIDDVLSDWITWAEIGGGLEGLEPLLRRTAQSFGSVPASLIDDGDELTLVLGHRDTPLDVDMLLREEYEPSMESVVIETVGTDLDAALATRLLGGGAADEDGVSRDAFDDLLAWGPPEERVRVLLDRAVPADTLDAADATAATAATDATDAATGDAAAWAALQAFAESWNAASRLPEAPRFPDELEASSARRIRTAWKGWYHERRVGPEEF